MRKLIPILFLLVGCLGDNVSLPDAAELPDASIDATLDAAEPDAVPLPRCADVGCPGPSNFCTMQGCCTCNVTGSPVPCLRADAEPNACEL